MGIARPWTAEEDAAICAMRRRGATLKVIAGHLRRAQGSVQGRAAVLMPETTLAAKNIALDALMRAGPRIPTTTRATRREPDDAGAGPAPRPGDPMASFDFVSWSAIWIESQLPVSEREGDQYGVPERARGRPREGDDRV